MAASLLGLAGCGGGAGGGASVSTITATNVGYGRSMLITVNGNLPEAAVRVEVDGACENLAPVPGGTDASRQFSCVPRTLGDLFVRAYEGGRELAWLRLDVPTPRVSMTVQQGTRSGTFVVELDPVKAPISTDNFLAYVNAGFYRSTIFHRVVENFVVQAGGYTAGATIKNPTRPAIRLESNNGLLNVRGTIAMARTSAPDSATSQFYVNVVDNANLDYESEDKPGYAVFGTVVSGLEVIDEIRAVPVRQDLAKGLTHLPVTDVVITSAIQTR